MVAEQFVTPFWLDLAATGLGSVQGASFAAQFKDRRLDLLGVGLIGVVAGFGGGLIRDLLLNTVPAALESNWFIPVAIVAALLGMLLERLFTRLNVLVTVLDAVSLGLFCAIGTSKALSFGLPVVPAIFVGIVAAVGGGMLRDILLGLPIGVMHVGSLYAVAAGAGAIFLTVAIGVGANITVAGIGCVIVTTLIRLLAVRFGWSLPEQRTISTLRRLRRQKRA
ncbi:TRIC cation channel family protein [Herbiconiux sp. CPCC 205716]|uniref:TRIC cation channel family protein n=1 Tax=Herbiconiux gentiana TaxID=2970912 RepID=A0ABT2GHB6_9MICO|nr:TRIC cation channel family protein [Herbiconiux gentiana]MCS5715619.1 TRIC cation channel family protein [Herbiconiux gentiana]